MAKSSQEIQAQIDDLQEKKKKAVAKEKEALDKKRKALSSKVYGIFNECIRGMAKEYNQEQSRELLNDILSDNDGTLEIWNAESCIDEYIIGAEESFEAHKDYLKGLKEFKEEMEKNFK